MAGSRRWGGGGGGARGLIHVSRVTHHQIGGGGETASATSHLWVIENYNKFKFEQCGHYIGLHIPPAVIEYGTPGINAGKKDPEWEHSE